MKKKNLLKLKKRGVKKNLWAENLWVKLEALLLYLMFLGANKEHFRIRKFKN